MMRKKEKKFDGVARTSCMFCRYIWNFLRQGPKTKDPTCHVTVLIIMILSPLLHNNWWQWLNLNYFWYEWVSHCTADTTSMLDFTLFWCPPPPPSRLRGFLCVFPISGKLTDLLRAFPHNIHPLSRELFALDPVYLEHCGDRIQFLFISFLFFGLGKYVYVVYYILPSGGGRPSTDIQYNKGPTPFFREAIESSGNKYV